MLLDQPRECIEIASASMRSECAPFRRRCPRGTDGSVDIAGTALSDPRQLLAVRRIKCVEVFSGRGCLPGSVDEESKTAAVAIEPCGGFFGIFGSRSVLHADEFFGNAHIRLVRFLYPFSNWVSHVSLHLRDVGHRAMQSDDDTQQNSVPLHDVPVAAQCLP